MAPRWHTWFWLLPALMAGVTQAAGPSTVATGQRQLWPASVNTIAGFNQASRAALAVYRQTLLGWPTQRDAQLQEQVHTKSLNRASVNQWLQREQAEVQTNWQQASADCQEAKSDDWSCDPSWVTAPATRLPATLTDWYRDMQEYSRSYQLEQLRLAALFPKISSEIARFNTQEQSGSELPDRHFLLSFDDGPSAAGGHSDQTLIMLQQQQKSALFFMLGSRLSEKRQQEGAEALRLRYQGQCVASHGWEHQSHAKWPQWQESVLNTQKLLKETFRPDQLVPLFRPPYGQRRADSGTFFAKEGITVTLWGLDSQDWNTHLSNEDVLNRMRTLMLIKRHGILLFHDVHPKAVHVLPTLFTELGSAVQWLPCHTDLARH